MRGARSKDAHPTPRHASDAQRGLMTHRGNRIASVW